MSFLWRSSDGSSETCKNCVDKDKRIADYDVFFNETKDVLKTKDEKTADLQIQICEKISEIELLKKSYEAEKRMWMMEDKKIWAETNKKYQLQSIEWELDKAKYEEMLEDMNNEKMISSKYQKTLEDKITNLVHSLKEADAKYQDLMQRVTEQNVLQSDELREREEDITSIYDKKIQEMFDDFEERETQWLERESDLEAEIQRLNDLNADLKMEVQDFKYDQQCLADKHEQLMKEQEDRWGKRVAALNDSYDVDFIQYKTHFKQKEELMEKEKQELLETLKSEIDKLKKENEVLEQTKSHIEKKINEINLENKTLKDSYYDEQKRNQILESEIQANKKILETQQTINFASVKLDPENEYSAEVNSLPFSIQVSTTTDLEDQDLRRKKKSQNKKRTNVNHGAVQSQGGFNGFYPPFVEMMDKNYEKKTGELETSLTDHVVIDIEESSEDGFFLSKTSSPTQTSVSSEAQVKLNLYGQEIEKLKQQNQEYANKLKSYECNSILQFNRNLRSGIPVRFFAYHTNSYPIMDNSLSCSTSSLN